MQGASLAAAGTPPPQKNKCGAFMDSNDYVPAASLSFMGGMFFSG